MPRTASGPGAEDSVRAIAMARTLMEKRGAHALGCASERVRRATRSGNIAHADFYTAVCAIIGDRDRVFSRLKRKRAELRAPATAAAPHGS